MNHLSYDDGKELAERWNQSENPEDYRQFLKELDEGLHQDNDDWVSGLLDHIKLDVTKWIAGYYLS